MSSYKITIISVFLYRHVYLLAEFITNFDVRDSVADRNTSTIMNIKHSNYL